MGKRIMVVDDSRITKLQLEQLLEDSEYEIVAYCKNGEAAVAQYMEVQPDIIVLDIIMPGMDGLETASVITAEHPEAKIVIMSSLVYEDTIDAAHAVGAKGFLFKPLERDQVLSTLAEALS